MKKLFLYLSLFIITFFAAFLISREYWSAEDNSLAPKETTGELTTEEENDVFSSEVFNIAEAGSRIPEEKEAAMAENEPETDEKDQYIVGIKNGYVIVYLNDTDSVYEYTGIDAEVIRLLQSELYDNLKNKMYFDDKEQLFRFLESIAS